MKKTVRWLALILCATMLLLSFTACSGCARDPETENETESDTEAGSVAVTERESESESELDSEGKTETESELETKNETETEGKSETESESATESETETESAPETESASETESESESESESDSETTHTHAYGEWEVVITPTCSDAGLKERVCACGDKKTEPVSATGHTYGEWVTVTDPTCATAGLKERACACGHKDTETVPTTAHTPGDAATCTTAQICTACGATLASATGHDYGEWVTVTHPTCTTAGLKTHACACGHTATETIPATGHTPGDAATCTTSQICTACGDTLASATGHTPGEWVVTREPTVTTEGEKARRCTACEEVLETETLPATGMVSPGGEYMRDGNTIYFGSYPQSKVTDRTLMTALNGYLGRYPTSTNSRSWTSYGYYIDKEVQNYMWYQDVVHEGETYRAVVFSSYRPYDTNESSEMDHSYQDDNDYCASTIYWFKYEPIAWTILTENDGTALILCNMVIDSQEYNYTWNSQTVDDTTIYANNYAYSTIRAWLHDAFYETAFNDLQKALILTTIVDNSAASTGEMPNDYACEDTEDKVFLLSYKDVINSDYGFDPDGDLMDIACQKQATDYAKCQGVYVIHGVSHGANSPWWLRSPESFDSSFAFGVQPNGVANVVRHICSTNYGVVPALWIQL